jgi:hypothetical membrane protein
MNRPVFSRFAALPAILWLLAGIGWLTGEAITASAYPRYDYATNYISDLGVPQVGSFQGRAIDSPLHAVMNATFVGEGILYVAAAIVAVVAFRRASRRVAVAVGVIAVVFGIGISLVGTFHGSQASVDDGTIVFHILGASSAIVAANVVSIVVGANARKLGAPRAYRIASVVLGILGIVSLIMLEVDSGSTAVNIFHDGVWERGSVYTVIAWELLTAVSLLIALARRRGATVRTVGEDRA